MKIKIILLLSILTFISLPQCSQANSKKGPKSTQLKPRIVVLTDVSTWETDDSESLVRLMVHADLFEIEGLIFTTGWSLDETRDDFFDLIHDAIDAYEKDLPNLLKRSNQVGFLDDESQQFIGYWPSPEYLRERSMFGSKKRGISFIGEGNESPGSRLIIEQADIDDGRPLWITVWGGGNTLAQAIWQVQQERSEEELKAFLHKIPTYTITDQDRKYDGSEGFEISAHQWLRREFEKNLMFLWDECAWKYQNGTGRSNWEQYATHIQTHGNLGSVYPKYKYGVEGDTPAFLHLLPNGLNDPTVPGQIGWGGYFEWGTGPDNVTNAYTNHHGKAHEICSKYEGYFYPATFNNFAARMDWAAEGKGNRNPIIVVDGDQSLELIYMEAKQGKTLTFDASKSFDPDGDQLVFKWWVLPEAGTNDEQVNVSENNTSSVKVTIPASSAGKTIHLICEVRDNGTPELTSYRRIIIQSKD
ncbi:nucleoside hydrolase-like domain-containing protein [Bacteroidota bacterium]